jgi:ribose transport system substrate-binding protein
VALPGAGVMPLNSCTFGAPPAPPAAGCGSGGGGGQAAAGGAGGAPKVQLFKGMTPAPGSATVDVGRYRSDKSRLTIGFSDISLVNSWRVQARREAEMTARQLGVNLKVTDAGGDATKQIADVEDLLAQGVDALVVTPAAPKPLAPVIERAHQAGIPVVLWSTKAATDQFTAGVFSDEVYFGRVGAEQLAKDMGGRGNVIMLRGIAGVSVDADRYNGAREAFAKHPGIKVVGEQYGEWAFAPGKAAAENLLAAHPKIDGVWSSGAEMTRGAVQAFQEAGRPLVPMSGEHNNGFLKLWKRDRLRSVAPITPTWMAPEAVKLAVMARRGQPFRKEYVIRPAPITNATLDQWIKPYLSDDYWPEGYLTDAQARELFAGGKPRA